MKLAGKGNEKRGAEFTRACLGEPIATAHGTVPGAVATGFSSHLLRLGEL